MFNYQILLVSISVFFFIGVYNMYMYSSRRYACQWCTLHWSIRMFSNQRSSSTPIQYPSSLSSTVSSRECLTKSWVIDAEGSVARQPVPFAMRFEDIKKTSPGGTIDGRIRRLVCSVWRWTPHDLIVLIILLSRIPSVLRNNGVGMAANADSGSEPVSEVMAVHVRNSL
jgi:hypothetical protein